MLNRMLCLQGETVATKTAAGKPSKVPSPAVASGTAKLARKDSSLDKKESTAAKSVLRQAVGSASAEGNGRAFKFERDDSAGTVILILMYCL